MATLKNNSKREYLQSQIPTLLKQCGFGKGIEQIGPWNKIESLEKTWVL